VRFGAENSKKTIAAGALFLVAIVMFIRMISGSSIAASPTSTATAPPPPAHPVRTTTHRGLHGKEKATGPVTPSLDPRLHLTELSEAEDTTYDGTGRNIFMDTEEPKIPVAHGSGLLDAKNPSPPQPIPPPQPIVRTPPPINLKFFGFASGPDHKRVFLAQGDEVFVASEGDIVQRRYKIVKINNNNIEILDVLNNNHQTIPLTAG